MQTLQNLSPLMDILDPCHYHSIPSDLPLEFLYTVTQNIFFKKKGRKKEGKEGRVWLCLYTCTCSPLLLVRGAAWAYEHRVVRAIGVAPGNPNIYASHIIKDDFFPVQSSLTHTIYWVFIPSPQDTVLCPVWETDGNFWRWLGCHCSKGPGAAIWSCSKAVLYKMAPNSKK